MNTTKKTYGQILKSSVLIGGSSVVSMGLLAVRTKVMAVLLGPAGVGLFGLYWSITELTRSVTGMGINSSGVRQIAESAGTVDARRIACTATTLRRVAFYFGAFGALVLLCFSKPVSRLTFGDYDHTGWVALLSLAVLLGNISGGQTAFVQGMRQVSYLARMNVLGALYGTLLSIPIIYFFRENGVAPSLVCVVAMSVVTSWWYARKIKIESVSVGMRQIVNETSDLLKLGAVFVASGLIFTGVAYLIRIIVLHRFGVEAAGFYQAAWILGGVYVGFILQAMGADFYPRLTAVARDNPECNRLVNEQAEVGLLLAVPGVLATLTFAPLVMDIFYSTKFEPAVEILRWICLGMVLRVISWPMGFILIAKGARGLFFWTELLSGILQVGLVWVCVLAFGVNGTGIAFFASYVAYWIAVYAVVRHVSGFRWSAVNKKLACLFMPVVAVFFVCWYFLPHTVTMILGLTISLLVGIYSMRAICALVPFEQIPSPARKIITLFRLAPESTAV